MKKNNNICKFTASNSTSTLSTANFVFETDPSNFNKSSASSNRINLVTSGKSTIATDAGTFRIEEGDVFFTFSALPATVRDAENFEYMYISFSGARCDELFQRFGITPKNCVFKCNDGTMLFWQNSLIKANDKNLDLISESVLLYTLGELTAHTVTAEDKLLDVILMTIDENFSDCTFDLGALSDKIGYNAKYISRVFTKSMGITFSKYLTNTRIRNAIFLIEQGVTSVKNLALLSGYSDPLYFSGVFKSITGSSPTSYIEKLKG